MILTILENVDDLCNIIHNCSSNPEKDLFDHYLFNSPPCRNYEFKTEDSFNVQYIQLKEKYSSKIFLTYLVMSL